MQGPLYMTHMLSTWLCNYPNWGHSHLCVQRPHSRALNPRSCVVFRSKTEREYSEVIFRSRALGLSGKDGCVSSSSHACDLRGAPATRQLPLKCLKMAARVQSTSGELRCFLSCQNRRVVEITGLTSACFHLLRKDDDFLNKLFMILCT